MSDTTKTVNGCGCGGTCAECYEKYRAPAPSLPPDATTTTDEPAYDMSIHSNPDASAWAAFFAKTFAPGSPCPDEATMLGWFANAMMAQHDHDRRASPRPSSEPTRGDACWHGEKGHPCALPDLESARVEIRNLTTRGDPGGRP